jgi:hypothetical protein
MKKNALYILLAFAAHFIGCTKHISDHRQTINPVIGDISYIEKFGERPTASTPENVRIQTHLLYAANLLRQKDVSNLSPELREKRKHLLDLLCSYAEAGIFPHNYDNPGQRLPCFIDKNGTICAVGYLVEQTAGRNVAEEINSKHKYGRISEMNDEGVDAWISTSGLTKEECAIIQPQYKEEEVTEFVWSAIGSYRAGDNFYPSIDASIQLYKTGRYDRSGPSYFTGAGIRFDYLRGQNFQVGLRIYSQFFSDQIFFLRPVWSVAPELFLYESTYGMNFKPELGIIIAGKSVFSFHLLYGYDIPVIARRKFGVGRNDLSAKLCVSLTRIHHKKHPPKPHSGF